MARPRTARTVTFDHDEAVARALAARDGLTLAAVADAFLASLAHGRLELRSALRSYVIVRHLPRHPFTPTAVYSTKYICGVCEHGHYYGPATPLELDDVEAGRANEGAVGFGGDPGCAALDLEHFASLGDVPPPDDADRGVLRDLVAQLVVQGAAATRASADKALSAALRTHGAPRSNSYQRRALLETLGWAGVLRTAEHPGSLSSHVPFDRRPTRSEWGWPLGYWSGRDGLGLDALAELFPSVFSATSAPPERAAP